VIPDTLVIYLTDLGAMNKSGKDAARESRVETKRRISQELREKKTKVKDKAEAETYNR